MLPSLLRLFLDPDFLKILQACGLQEHPSNLRPEIITRFAKPSIEVRYAAYLGECICVSLIGASILDEYFLALPALLSIFCETSLQAR